MYDNRIKHLFICSYEPCGYRNELLLFPTIEATIARQCPKCNLMTFQYHAIPPEAAAEIVEKLNKKYGLEDKDNG